MIPPEVINEIRERADIVAVVGQHVQLRKAGRNHKGLCPFHQEKTPSFNVKADDRFFYCFGCQKKGDVFTFLMEYEGKSFLEAARSLAATFGVTIPERPESPAMRRQRSERARMFEINRAAMEFFRQTLLHERDGAQARAYLESRGIGAGIAEKFNLGFAPDTWRALGDHLAAQRIPADIVERLGLIVKRPRAGGHYDRFRNRLMCPVINPGGEVSGFSGRTMAKAGSAPPDQMPAKYINSPESPVYKKSKLLFGIHLARPAFRRTGRAILVEGNFDVISLHQAGFEETVAPLGTALTEQQGLQLLRLADEVVLLYDGDRAGRAAALKSLAVLMGVDIRVRIAALPMDSDPDSVVAQGGTDALAEILRRAQPGVEYFAHEIWSRTERSADGIAAALAEAAPVLQKVANPTKRDLITGTLATSMGIDPALVRREIKRYSARSSRPERQHPDRRHPPEQAAPRPRRTAPLPPRKELDILAILADHPQLLATVDENDVVSLLTDARLRDMYFAARQGTPMLSVAPDEISQLVAKHVMSGSYTTVKDPEHTLRDAMEQLRRERQVQRTHQLHRELQDADRRGDTERARQLAREIRQIRQILTTRKQDS